MTIVLDQLRNFKPVGNITFDDKLNELGFDYLGKADDNLKLFKEQGITLTEDQVVNMERTWVARNNEHTILCADYGNTHGEFLCELTPEGVEKLLSEPY